jgi:hypothetical protein
MWLSLFFLGLVFAVAIRQGTQGLFSSFVMLVLTVCCAAAAFGTYEWVAVNLLAPHWKPDYALPIALGAIFGVSLLLLRLLFDRLVTRAPLLPAWVDRVGGSVCGLMVGLIMVGTAATCLQMIPFGNGSILGYRRVIVVDRAERRNPDAQPGESDAEEGELWLTPDRFAAGLASVLSSGIFSGEASFGQLNPNLIQSIGWVGAAHAEVSRFAPPRSISIVRAQTLQFVYKFTPGDDRQGVAPTYEPQQPRAGHEFRMVRVGLRNEARDERKSHVFTLRQFHVVGRSADGVYEQYHPIALQQEDAEDLTNRHIQTKMSGRRFWPLTHDRFSPRTGNNNEVEIVFELPTGFTPTFLEYKRLARVALSFDETATIADAGRRRSRRAEEPASTEVVQSVSDRPASLSDSDRSTADASKTSGTTKRSRRRRGARSRGVAAGSGPSRFGDGLPITMRSYQRFKNAEISRGALIDGHIVGAADDQANGTNPPVSRFDVPRDKRLLQLNVSRLKARSAYGRALSQAVTTVQNYFVMDDRGRRYSIIGKYAIATVGGRRVIEVLYFSSPTGSIGGLGKFNRIDERKLKPDDRFALLFLVDPGARIVSFSTGGAASRQDDLAADNLVAPR